MDFATFSHDTFNPKQWINESLQKVKPTDLENEVSTMLMRLQMLSTEVNTSFEETSSQALIRLPKALIEMERMAKEARNLRSNLNSLLQGDVSESQSQTKKSVETMNMLHGVSRKLDLCRETISQAVFLQQNVKKMRDIMSFEQRDTAEIGSEISKMQSGLKHLEAYPEQHSKFASTIAQFESQLMGMVEVDCLKALLERDVPSAHEHLQTLGKIGKLDDVVKQYIQKSIGKILEAWQSFDAAAEHLPTWLPSFFGEIQALVESEKGYYTDLFGRPDHYRQLVVLVVTVLESLQPTMGSRLATLALPDVVAAYTTTSLLFTFCCDDLLSREGTAGLPASTTAGFKASLERSVYQPFVDLQKKYATLEKGHVQVCVKRMSWVEKVTATPTLMLTPSLVTAIAESCGILYTLSEEALNRCIEFTDGVECQGLLKALNEVLVEYTDLVLGLVKRYRTTVGAPPPEDSPPPSPSARVTGGEDPVGVKIGLHLHAVCGALTANLDQFEGLVKRAILGKKPSILGPHLTPLSRVLREQPHKVGPLNNFFRSLEQLKITVFDTAANHFQDLLKEVEGLVFDVLFEGIKPKLMAMPADPVWASTEEVDDLVTSLVQTENMRLIGDYLFNLPLKIEAQAQGLPAAARNVESDVTAQSRYWLNVVTRGALDMFLQYVEQIEALTPFGAQQLSVDVQYFGDIINSLCSVQHGVLKDLHQVLVCNPADAAHVLNDAASPDRLSLYRTILERRGTQPSQTPTGPS